MSLLFRHRARARGAHTCAYAEIYDVRASRNGTDIRDRVCEALSLSQIALCGAFFFGHVTSQVYRYLDRDVPR